MHYFKVAGILLILAAGALAGLGLSAFERRRCRQANGFLALVRYIRLQIDYFSQPVPRILASCENSVLADCGVESDKLADLTALLRSTRLYLPEDMCRLLWEFGNRLGGSYREDQLRCCDYLLERFTPYCDRLRAELPKREKMMLLLPVSLAATLVLLLI